MKTLYITRGNNIVVDTENNTVDRISCERTAIDDLYRVKEPMHVIYQRGEYKREADVVPGDLVITFYDNDFLHQMIVVKNSDWAETLDAYEKQQQEEKEKWAAEQKSAVKKLNDLGDVPDACCESKF